MAEKPKIFTKIFHRTSKRTYRPPASGAVELKSITFDKDNLGLGEFIENNIEKVRKIEITDGMLTLTGYPEKYYAGIDYFYIDCKVPMEYSSNDTNYGILTTHAILTIYKSQSVVHLYVFHDDWYLAIGSSTTSTIHLENYYELTLETLDKIFTILDKDMSIKVYYE